MISSYSVASEIAVPLTGWLARRVGEVKLFKISVLLFSLASVLCGFAHNFESLIAFRLLQVLVSGPMVPLSQTILMRSYPPGKRGLALDLWAMTVIVAPIFGPVMGGYITDNYTWPWIFYINVPIGVFSRRSRSSCCAGMKQDDETAHRRRRADAARDRRRHASYDARPRQGPRLVQFELHRDASNRVGGVARAYVFAWELTEKEPVIDLSLFRDRNFAMGVLITSLGFLALVLSPMIGRRCIA